MMLTSTLLRLGILFYGCTYPEWEHSSGYDKIRLNRSKGECKTYAGYIKRAKEKR